LSAEHEADRVSSASVSTELRSGIGLVRLDQFVFLQRSSPFQLALRAPQVLSHALRHSQAKGSMRRSRRFFSWLVPTRVDRDLLVPKLTK
jgi:hypothetical protein